MRIIAPPGAFPRKADRALCNFLHVTLTPNPKISDFGRLDGACSPHPRSLYSGSGLFRGYIARFVKKSSRPRRNFASAREILSGQSVKCNFRRKSRYGESKMEISEKLPPQWLWPERALEMNVAPWPAGHLIFWPIWKIRLQKKSSVENSRFFEIWNFWNLKSENFETWNLKFLKSEIWKFRPNSFFWRRFFLKTANLLLFT